ncbi:MAG: metallophosphoesterase family protein [bacterium]
MKIGVLSDTHGFINPNVFSIFDGVELILHAGDIGSEDIITSLETLAPVKAIHGNMDTFPLSTRYLQILTLEIHEVAICMIHQFISVTNSVIQNAALKLPNNKIDLLIYGHTHQPKLERVDGVLLFNPGSAGKRRFSLRPTVGLLTILNNGKFIPEIIYLEEY